MSDNDDKTYGLADSEDDEFVYLLLQSQVRHKLMNLRIQCEHCILELAKETGISSSDLIEMEAGRMPISVENSRKILDALKYFSFENNVLKKAELSE